MRQHNLVPAVIGKDGRTSAIERCLLKSARVATDKLLRLSDGKQTSSESVRAQILHLAEQARPDFVVIGPEEPLANGIADLLWDKLQIPSVGPTKALAQLESSKTFTRELLSKHGIRGNPEYRVFKQLEGVESFLNGLGEFVIKPDGLTAGKGVKVSGAHLGSVGEALEYCAELLNQHPLIVVEEKLEGEEFSLQSFCDGTHVRDMVVVQDHKRAFDGDTGPNTGGMGSYSCQDHSLPFLTQDDLQQAKAINHAVAQALFKETGQKYKGILYGGFMATGQGIRLLEYNARFGDPEALNVLSLLKTDFVDICDAIIEGWLDEITIEFETQASVCKYIVPEGYPDKSVKGERVDLSRVPVESDKLRIYHASVSQNGTEYYLAGSRAIAFVGLGQNLQEAEAIAEEAASAVRGPVFHRTDIGTSSLINRRVEHMQTLRAGSGVQSEMAQ